MRLPEPYQAETYDAMVERVRVEQDPPPGFAFYDPDRAERHLDYEPAEERS